MDTGEVEMGWLERILVASDLSACSTAALRYATFLATFYEASLELIHVLEHGVDTVCAAARRAKLQAAIASVQGPKGPLTRLVIARGDPAAQVVHYAALQQVDLVVVGRHGANADGRWPIGEVAAHIVWGCHRECLPVLPVAEDARVPVVEGANRPMLLRSKAPGYIEQRSEA